MPRPPDQSGKAPAVVTIGNFDGVHAGHRKLLAAALEIGRRDALDPCLVTFWPHPVTVLRPEAAHRPLSEREERAALLAGAGFSRIVEIEFDAALAALSAEEFVARRLLPLNMAALVIGHDFSLGRGGEGDFAALAALGDKYGFALHRVAAHLADGAAASSTRAREAIAAGDAQKAARLLGRPYAIRGEIIRGFGRGRGLGFPTANIAPPKKLLPARGVYATIAEIDGKPHPAITNIGENPTFGGEKLSVETFLLQGGGDFYGKRMSLFFVGRIRGEIRFSSPDELAAQINRDIAAAREMLDLSGGNLLPPQG